MNPYQEHVALSLAKERTRELQRRAAVRNDFVASWSKRPALCRLGIHRPVVWACPPNLLSQEPHCGTCGYSWRDLP